VAYKLVLLGLGWLGRRRTHDATDFYLAGRSLGPVVAAVSSAASSSSAWTLLGVSGAAYARGLSALWLFPACVGGFMLNWYVLGPGLHRLAHRSDAVTVTEVLAGPVGAPWGRPLRMVASIIVLGSLGVYVCSQLQGAGKTFAATFDVGMTESVLVGAVIVVAYTLMGGFWAVSLTDTLQGLLMAATSLILPLAALAEIGGPAALADALRSVPDPSYLSLTADLPLMAGLGLIFGMLGIGLGYPGQPHVVNRFMALKAGDQMIVTARRVAMTWAVIVFAGMLLLGLCGRVLFPGLPDHETVFVFATNALFPPVLAGVMLAAVLSAIMSTADSQLLVAASAVTHDLGLGRRRPLLASRLVVLGLAAAATVGAITTDASIFDRVLFAWGAMGAAFGPLLLVTVLRGPVSPPRTLAAMLAGCGLSVAAYYLFPDATDKIFERVLPFVVVFGLILIGARSRRPSQAPRR
jgi:sodium/proline symporter